MILCPQCNGLMPSRVTCANCKAQHCPKCAVVHATDGLCKKPAIVPYDYQRNVIEKAWERIRPDCDDRSGIVTMATGLGKTVVAGLIAKRWIEEVGTRVLFLAHREELVFQASKELAGIIGQRVEVEMAANTATKIQHHWTSPAVSASVPTLVAGRNCPECAAKLIADREAWQIMNPDRPIEDYHGIKLGCSQCMGGMIRRLQNFETPFGLVIVDECFVAGTRVDGRPIETIAVGDFVDSFNHATGAIERKQVKHVFVSKSNQILRVTFRSGRSITCTAGHPFWSLGKNDYIPAASLSIGDQVATKGHYHVLRRVRKSNDQAISRKLSEDMLERMPRETAIIRDSRNQPQLCVGAHDRKKPNAPTGDPRKGFGNSQGHEVATNRASWEWASANDTPATACKRTWDRMGNGDCHTNTPTARQRIPNVLQGGYRESAPEDCNRGRRQFSQNSIEERTGQEENGVLGVDWVESVEILERRSGSQCFDGCKDRVVYNLEVDGNNNYFAEDVLVHNCHHAIAKSYRRIIEYCRKNWNASILGVTATPDRSDEKKLGIVFRHEIERYELTPAIEDGWLVKPAEQYVKIESWDLKNVERDRHDFVQKSLAEEVNKEKACQEVAAKILEHTGNLKTMVFCGSVAQAHAVAEIINSEKPGSAMAIDGTTDKTIRRKAIQDFAAGRLQYITNFGVFTEGFNERTIECLVMARPTKSRSVYIQMLGRGTRSLAGVLRDGMDRQQRLDAIAASAKPNLLVLDLHGQAGEHELVTMIDIIGDRHDRKLIDIVKKLARENPRKTYQELKELAQKKQAAAAAAKREARLKSNSTLVPSRQGSMGRQQAKDRNRDQKEPNQDRPTDKMIYALRALGVDEDFIRSASKAKAGKAIGMCKDRREKGLCNWDQAKKLRALGVVPTNVTYVEATRIISKGVQDAKL